TPVTYRLSLHDALPISVVDGRPLCVLGIRHGSDCARATAILAGWPARPRPAMNRRPAAVDDQRLRLSRAKICRLLPSPRSSMSRSEEHTSELQSRENHV